MKGHHALIEMRKQGRHPKWVFVNDYPCKTDWHEWGEHATICVDGDRLVDLDLRFLVGLCVSISSPILDRSKAIFELVKASGAMSAAACHTQPNLHHLDQTGWCEVWRKEPVVLVEKEVCDG